MNPRKSQRTSDQFLLENVILNNGGLKAGTSYYVQGNYAGIRGRLEKLCQGKAICRQAEKGWMVTPEVDIPVPVPPPAITIPAAMVTRKTIEDVVRYLQTQPLGSRCGMTQGPKNNAHLWDEFRQRGLRVTHEGLFGNRIITSVAHDDARVEALKVYKASKRTTEQYLIGRIKKTFGIAKNTPTYVQGNRTTLVRQLIRYVGSGNYSITEVKSDPRGPGHIVTVRIPIAAG
ncbi:MAG: hypothetical protein HZA93_08165 [Verrucomicrobia bacterium]|nr:hypothetical protein [Verrucomicrobiota bacterium]